VNQLRYITSEQIRSRSSWYAPIPGEKLRAALLLLNA